MEFWDRRLAQSNLIYCFKLQSLYLKVKVILHSLSNDPETVQVECLDVGNYPHPLSCAKYIQCAKLRGFIEGFVFTCSSGMNFDPVAEMCSHNQLGCTRNNVRLMTS